MGGFFSNPVKSVGNMLGGKKQSVKADVVNLDAGLFKQAQDDIGYMRGYASNPITGLNQSGLAAQDAIKLQSQGQLQDFLNQQMGQQNTANASLQRYGADSGASERLASNSMRAGLLGQQTLARGTAEDLANMTTQNLAQQEKLKYGAASALPQISSGLMNDKYKVDSSNAQSAFQAQLANMSADQARKQAIGGSLGAIGGMFGPVGGIAGTLAGGLF